MLKYGRKPKTPLFSPQRASVLSKTKTSKTRASIAGKLISHPILFQRDSTDELASMLLGSSDDTTQVQPKSIPTTRTMSEGEKGLPHLPDLLFNGDDAWTQRSRPVVTAVGDVNEFQFLEASEDAEYPSSSAFGHSADHSTPPIPRKSSRRHSTYPMNNISSIEPEDSFRPRSANATANLTSSQSTPIFNTHGAAMINSKISAMQAATKALKPDFSDELQPEPLVSSKKRRILDNKVVVRMRDAINDRLSSRSFSRKRRDSIRDDHLLDPALNELNEEEELSQYVSNIDIRLNEGVNFNNPKIFSLTGHGHVPRKPVADDGRSIRSRKSGKSGSTDPFSERPGSSGIKRTPTNFENLLDVPTNRNAEIIPDLPTSRPPSSRESIVGGRKLKGSPLSAYFDTESFDAFFSSSPLGQSTPRIRLEPTIEENGKRTLKSVPSDSRSVFDPESSSMMDVDSTPVKSWSGDTLSSQIKRKSSQLVESSAGFRYHSKRTKKHPSPSKAELEGYERILRVDPPLTFLQTIVLPDATSAQDQGSMDIDSSFPAPVLAAKDPNPRVKSPVKAKQKRRAIGLFPKPAELTRSTLTMPDLSKKAKMLKSMIPKPADKLDTRARTEKRHSYLDVSVGDSAMDIDEFQRSDSVFDIGRKML